MSKLFKSPKSLLAIGVAMVLGCSLLFTWFFFVERSLKAFIQVPFIILGTGITLDGISHVKGWKNRIIDTIVIILAIISLILWPFISYMFY